MTTNLILRVCSLAPNYTNGCGRGPFGRTLMKFSLHDTTLWSHAICAVIVNALTALYIFTYRSLFPSAHLSIPHRCPPPNSPTFQEAAEVNKNRTQRCERNFSSYFKREYAGPSMMSHWQFRPFVVGAYGYGSRPQTLTKGATYPRCVPLPCLFDCVRSFAPARLLKSAPCVAPF